MKLHGNARTCLHSRRLIVVRVLAEGWTLTQAAEAAGVSVRTVSKWLARFRCEGGDGLVDRSSAPHRVPLRTPEERVELGRSPRRDVGNELVEPAGGNLGRRKLTAGPGNALHPQRRCAHRLAAAQALNQGDSDPFASLIAEENE
jgi:hypothetical protein